MFEKLFSFKGRISRTEYLGTLIFCAIVGAILKDIINNTGTANLIIAYIPLFWISLAQSAKREHDLGFSGWWQLYPFRFFWLIFLKGELCLNHYGETPDNLNSKYLNTLGAIDYLFVILIIGCVFFGFLYPSFSN